MRFCFTIHFHFGCLNQDFSPALGLCGRGFPRQQNRVLCFPMCEIIIIRLQKGSAAFPEARLRGPHLQ